MYLQYYSSIVLLDVKYLVSFLPTFCFRLKIASSSRILCSYRSVVVCMKGAAFLVSVGNQSSILFWLFYSLCGCSLSHSSVRCLRCTDLGLHLLLVRVPQSLWHSSNRVCLFNCVCYMYQYLKCFPVHLATPLATIITML